MKFWALIAAAFGVVMAFFKAVALGKAAEKGEQANDTLDRIKDGQNRVDDNRDGDPIDRVRRNDGHW